MYEKVTSVILCHGSCEMVKIGAKAVLMTIVNILILYVYLDYPECELTIFLNGVIE